MSGAYHRLLEAADFFPRGEFRFKLLFYLYFLDFRRCDRAWHAWQ